MWETQNKTKTFESKLKKQELKMVYIVIGTVEYARVITRLCMNKTHSNEQAQKHDEKLQKYKVAQNRLNELRGKNGHTYDEKIDFHSVRKTYYQQLADKYSEDIQVFQNSFLHDGLPGTPEEFASRIGTTLQARIDFEIQTGRRRPKEEIKEEPNEEVKQEPLDIKTEPIALPNVIKSEPQ